MLQQEGLVPRLPVELDEFADPEVPERWRRERGLTVSSMHDPGDPRREVDLFAFDPVPFDELGAASEVVSVAGRRISRHRGAHRPAGRHWHR
jgi:hypothetical protein